MSRNALLDNASKLAVRLYLVATYTLKLIELGDIMQKIARSPTKHFFDELRDIDWTNLEDIQKKCNSVTGNVLTTPNMLSDLVDDFQKRDDLQELSEIGVGAISRKYVLHNDHEADIRVRIHIMKNEMSDRIVHDHRFNFHTEILWGSYLHLVYNKDSVRRASNTSEIKPSLVHTMNEGDSYTISSDFYHDFVTTDKDVVTLMYRGPRIKETSKDIYISENIIESHHSEARAEEASAKTVYEKISPDTDIHFLRQTLKRVGLIRAVTNHENL